MVSANKGRIELFPDPGYWKKKENILSYIKQPTLRKKLCHKK
jgi:hypothetical protein